MMESDHTPEASTNIDAQGDTNLTQPNEGEQPTSVEASSTLEENIKQILKPYADAYFNENDASTIAAEFKQHNKWRKEELNNLSAAVLSLYQKELVRELETLKTMSHSVDEYEGDVVNVEDIDERIKLTGEQP